MLVLGILPCGAGFGPINRLCVIRVTVQAVVHYNELGSAVNVLLSVVLL